MVVVAAEESEGEVMVAQSTKNYTVEDIMSLGNKLTLSKKKPAAGAITKPIQKKKP